MTIAALQEVLSDRIGMLESALRQNTTAPTWLPNADERSERDRARLEGRLEELRVCLGLVEKLELDEEHPLFELSEQGIRRIDDQISDDWCSQPRGDWPTSTFGGADVLS
jgi:hypothetical protein